LVFPRLQTLRLKISDVNGSHFIQRAAFPNLEVVSLYFPSGEGETMAYPDNSSIFAPVPLPNLVKLTRRFPNQSWFTLTALIPRSTQIDNAELSFRSDELQVSTKFIDSLRYTLFMFQPVNLKLDMEEGLDDYYPVFLEAINHGSLKTLHISVKESIIFPSRARVNQTTMPIIKIPSLIRLNIEDMDADPSTHLFRFHSAEELQFLKLTLVIRAFDKRGLRTVAEPCVQYLCATLAPDTEGRMNCPNLSYCRCFLKNRNDVFVEESQFTNDPEVVAEIDDTAIRNTLKPIYK